MHDPWISGTVEGVISSRHRERIRRRSGNRLRADLRFDLRDGVLSHISLASDEGPLQIARWQGRARLHDGKIEIEKGTLISPGGAYEISGTASFGQVLDFKVTAATQAKAAGAGSLVYSITGTVAEPRVT